MAGNARKTRGKRTRHLEGVFTHRPAQDWLGRVILALGLAVLGYMGVASSLAYFVVKVSPARAYALAPGNGVILAAYAEDAYSRAPTADPGSLPATLSRRALLADPTAVKALTVLGFQASLRGNTAETDRIFSYSIGLSRRELRPRVWAIEEAVDRGDITEALRNYDIALRTSKDAKGLLFPTLSAALVEPRIRSALLRVLASNPVWKADFLTYVADSGVEPEGAIALIQEGRGIGVDPNDESRVKLVNALMAQNKQDKAWAYYRTFRSAAHRDRSRDPNFALEAPVRAVFDWQPGTDTRLSAAILRSGEGGLVDFAVPSSIGGELLSQTQLLPPGRYRLEGRTRGISQPERSRPFWSLTCHDGRELGRSPLPNSAQNGGRFSGMFTVPQDCRVQTLSLVARSTDNIEGVSGQVVTVQLVPAG